MKCPNCGLLNAANARFCGNCGTPFGALDMNAGNPNPGGSYTVNPPPQRSGLTAGSVGRGCLIAFAIVILLLIFSGRSCFSHRRHVRYGYRTQLVLPAPLTPYICQAAMPHGRLS